MKKLVVCIIGQDCAEWLDLAVESVKRDADAIVFIDGADSKEPTKEFKLLTEKYGFEVNEGERTYLNIPYRHDYKGANGFQRNLYLAYIKQHYLDYWCLVLDADEVVDDCKRLKRDIQELPPGMYSPNMIHLINDFMHEDATVERHYVPRRLFKIAEDMKYPETEHGVLTSSIEPDKGRYDGICIWHLAYVKHKFEILKKYKNHLAKSEMHSKDFLRTWYLSHLLGTYPAREVDLTKFPDVLARKFDVKDLAERIYFARRAQLEAKHFIDAANWKDHFKPKKVLDVGCGMGLRMYAMKTYGLDVEGIEISRFAINSNLFGLADKMVCIDVSLPDLQMGAYQYDLVIAYDVLEHIEPDRLDQTIENIKKMATKNILCSIPFVGDPNLEADKTHKIKQTKEWWENKFKEHGLKILEVPRHFAYRPQQILCTV